METEAEVMDESKVAPIVGSIPFLHPVIVTRSEAFRLAGKKKPQSQTPDDQHPDDAHNGAGVLG